MSPGPGRFPLRAGGLVLFVCFGLALAPPRGLASYRDGFDHLNAADLRLAGSAKQSALERNPSGELQMWRNQGTGNSGAVMPLRSFKIKTGHFCREYRETAIAQRQMASRDLTACRTPDGKWITLER